MNEPIYRPGHQNHGADVWDHAREAYSMGASAPSICEFYSLSLSTFRTRARREGWRRGDLSQDPGAFHTDDDTVHETMDAGAMAEAAWRSASEAVRRGRVREAHSWTRLARELRLQAQAEREARERADRFPPPERPPERLTERAVEAAPFTLSAPCSGATEGDGA